MSDPPILPPAYVTPGAKFSFNRGYWRVLEHVDRSTNITLEGNHIICRTNNPPGLEIHYLIRPNVLAWSTNAYTLDYVIYHTYWRTNAQPYEHPWSYWIFWATQPLAPYPHIVTSAPSSNIYHVLLDIPPPDDDYWCR